MALGEGGYHNDYQFSTRYFKPLTLFLKDPHVKPVYFFRSKKTFLGGGFKYFFFLPLLGEDFQFDDHIFQRGWFNHQLDLNMWKKKKQKVCWGVFWSWTNISEIGKVPQARYPSKGVPKNPETNGVKNEDKWGLILQNRGWGTIPGSLGKISKPRIGPWVWGYLV